MLHIPGARHSRYFVASNLCAWTVIVPLALWTVYRAWRGDIERHRRLEETAADLGFAGYPHLHEEAVRCAVTRSPYV
jgi:hypothetical protein